MGKRLFIGIDIGGTFTDLVIANDGGGRSHSVKTLTTPERPVEGVLTAIREGLALTGATPSDVRRIVHATTLPTNLVLERKGADVAFLMTAGFTDIFEMSRQYPSGPDRFNLRWRRPPTLVRRQMHVAVTERMGPRGDVRKPLDVDDLARKLDALAPQDPQSFAICLLHAYANPTHEEQAAELVRQRFPNSYVGLSSQVWPEYREYERAAATVLSAYVGPVLSSYIAELQEALRAMSISAELQIMQSNGAIMSATETAARAAYAIESGPAAGVIAAADLGRHSGDRNLVSFDMGGTTAKAGLIRDGEPRITQDFRIGAAVSAGGMRDAGEPIRIPVIDLAEVGAGGGSIAWVDAGGLLQVGPHSAGADPGPACYGRGGEQATVTDANVVLGYLNPDYFNGGRMQIDAGASAEAIRKTVADPLDLDTVAAARGIHDLANTVMGSAIRMITLQRGIDPREHSITAFGGAGPIHVVRLAEQFDIPKIIIPPSPGVRAAFGLIISDIAHDHVRTEIMPPAAPDAARINEIFSRLETTARAGLADEQARGAEIRLQRSADIRFAHKFQTLTVSLQSGLVDETMLADAEAAFRALYRDTFGVGSNDACQFVSYRVRATAVAAKPSIQEYLPSSADAAEALKGRRPAYFVEADGFAETPVYDRNRLLAGQRIVGPAIFEESDSTTICPPGFTAIVDRHLNLVINKA